MKAMTDLKIAIARKLLGWVEKLPKFQGGSIHDLQIMREFHRKQSEDFHEKSRVPDEIGIAYTELALIELFELEEFRNLAKSLRATFRADGRSKSVSDDLERSTNDLYAGGWHRIGVLYRDRPQVLLREHGIDRSIPEFVEYVSVWTHRITPSIVAIAFTFHHNESVNKSLAAIQTKRYLPDVEFFGLTPFGKQRTSHRETFVAAVAQRAVLTYLAEIRSACEKWIAKSFKGHLYRNCLGRDRLGAVEVFTISVTSKEETGHDWKALSGAWLDSYGFSDRDVFVQNDYVFNWPTKAQEGRSIPARIRKSANSKGHVTEFVLLSLVPPIALLKYIASIQKTVERYRFVSYNAAYQGSMSLRRSQLRATLRLQHSAMLLDRLKLETEQNSDWITVSMESIKGFVSSGSDASGESLDAVYNRIIAARIDSLVQHTKVVIGSMANYVATQNISAMYSLQRRMFWLAIIAAILALLSALAAYDKLIGIGAKASSWLHLL